MASKKQGCLHHVEGSVVGGLEPMAGHVSSDVVAMRSTASRESPNCVRIYESLNRVSLGRMLMEVESR